MFRTNQTRFDVNGGTISKINFNEVYYVNGPVRTNEIHAVIAVQMVGTSGTHGKTHSLLQRSTALISGLFRIM